MSIESCMLCSYYTHSEYNIPFLWPPCDWIPRYMTSFQSSPVRIWKTVSRAMGNVLKLVGGVSSGKLNWPPNNCMPNSANIRMNKKSRNNSEMILLIELSNEITRLRSDDQYLVTLNIRKRRKARRTEKPKDPPLICDHTTSNIDPQMTTQSKRLNDDSK